MGLAMKTNLLWLIFCCLWTSHACFAQTEPTSTDSDESKLVQQMYAKRVAEVKATASDADNIHLVRQMLVAASDDTVGLKLKAALALCALDMASQIGSQDAQPLVTRAMELAGQAISTIQKQYYQKQVATHRVLAARGQISEIELGSLALVAVDAGIAYVKLAASEEACVSEVASTMRQLRSFTTLYRLKDSLPELDELDKLVRVLTMKRLRLKEALVRLEALRRAEDSEGAKTASKAVAQIHLETDGDVRSAAEFFKNTDDPRAETVINAAKLMGNPAAVEAAKAGSTIVALAVMSEGLQDPAKANVAATALELAQKHIATNPKDDPDRMKLLVDQLQQTLGHSGPDKIKKDLNAAYGPIQGKIEVLGADRVRISYDFSHPSQLKDFESEQGTWDIGKGVFGSRSRPYNRAETRLRLPFRFDRPFKITFMASGKYEVGCELHCKPWQSDYADRMWFRLSNDGINCYAWNRSFDSQDVRLGDKSSLFELTKDANNKLTLSINGKIVREMPVSEATPYYVNGCFRVGLGTRSSDRVLTLFDNLSIEGSILPNADWRPSTSDQKRSAQTSNKRSDAKEEKDTGKKVEAEDDRKKRFE